MSVCAWLGLCLRLAEAWPLWNMVMEEGVHPPHCSLLATAIPHWAASTCWFQGTWLDVLAWSLTNSLGDPEWLGLHPCQGEGVPLDLSLSASGTKGALLQVPTLIFRYIFSFSHTHTTKRLLKCPRCCIFVLYIFICTLSFYNVFPLIFFLACPVLDIVILCMTVFFNVFVLLRYSNFQHSKWKT